MMVLALKLITAGVSYQDGLKKPEVTFRSPPCFFLHNIINWSDYRQGALLPIQALLKQYLTPEASD